MVDASCGRVCAWFGSGFSEFRAALNLSAAWRDASATSPLRIMTVVTAAVCLVGSGVGQVILLNKLLNGFPQHSPDGPVGGPFTVIVGSGVVSTAVFGVLLLIALLTQPATRNYYRHVVFAGRRRVPGSANLKAWGAVAVYGMCGACNGIFLAYGAANTPELIQSMVLSTQLIFLVLFSAAFKLGVAGRSYCNVMVLTAVALSIAGVAVGTAGNAQSMSASTGTIGWIFILLIGVIALASAGVAIAVFFRLAMTTATPGVEAGASDECYYRRVASVDDEVSGASAYGGCAAASPAHSQGKVSRVSGGNRYHGRVASDDIFIAIPGGNGLPTGYGLGVNDEGSPTTGYDAASVGPTACADEIGANLWLLFFGNLFTVAFNFIFFPLDWAPFFGMTTGQVTSRAAFSRGMHCLFGAYPGCTDTVAFFFGGIGCMVVMMAAMAVMSRVSPPLSGMLTQLSAPVCAIMLVVFPSLNASPSQGQVGPNVGTLVLVGAGAFVFALWERLGVAAAAADAAGVPDGPESSVRTDSSRDSIVVQG
jgi:hypothetical protein